MPIRPLSKALQAFAEEAINEQPDEVEKNLDRLREWIRKQAHLDCRLDDQWLISFLRGCKFSLERTKAKLDNFYTMRSIDPQIFGNRDPFSSSVREFLSAGYFVPLPKPQDPTAPRTILIHTSNYDPDAMNPTQALKSFLMTLDVLLNVDDNFVIAGQQILLNLSGFDYRMLLHLTPSVIKKVSAYLLNGYPLRPKGVHVINSPAIYETVVNLVTTLVSDKINQRIKFYKDEDFPDVYKFVPRSILPTEYGGTAGTVKELAGEWTRKVESYDNWFKEDANYGVDESKRVEKSRIICDLMGVEGSFRTLTID